MKITSHSSPIRQQQPGQFTRRADGAGPFAHINKTKVDSRADQKALSVFVRDQKLLTVEKGLGSDFPRLFDHDAGLEVKPDKTRNGGEEKSRTYAEAGKTKTQAKQKNTIDKWA
ncbi:MAG: hypothetical protein V1736_02190 [Pseudomonadota bacterium]